MREIKLRMWADKKMDYDCRDLTIWNGIIVPFEDGIIMQFTGLKDRNGKEIYEGDIIRHYDTSHPYVKEINYIKGVVKFGEYKLSSPQSQGGSDDYYIVGFYLENEFERKSPNIWCESTEEIIGNIYENPELVERSEE